MTATKLPRTKIRLEELKPLFDPAARAFRVIEEPLPPEAPIPAITWQKDALDLLLNYDRLTRRAIREGFEKSIRYDFNQATRTNIAAFDPENSGFVTKVADNKFGVVWYLRDDAKTAEVVAAIPVPTDLAKDAVQQAVKAESKGKVLIP